MFQFDCHAHVYETVTTIPGARYVPKAPAPLSVWLGNLKRHGLSGGVIVQVSFLGTDNSQLCAALAQLDRDRFAGVAVVPITAKDHELDRLVAAGVRGLRWNLVRGATIPNIRAPEVQAFFDRLRARGLHLELHLEGPRLAPLLPALCDQGVNLVIDHFGLPSEPWPEDDPMIRAVRQVPDRSNLYFKLSAQYRTPFDIRPHARELLALLGQDHAVWGSDWPHTQHESATITAEVHRSAQQWERARDQVAAETLFGLRAPSPAAAETPAKPAQARRE